MRYSVGSASGEKTWGDATVELRLWKGKSALDRVTQGDYPQEIFVLLLVLGLVLVEPLIELRRCVGGRPAVVPDMLEGRESHLFASSLADGFDHLIRVTIENRRIFSAMKHPDRHVD